MADMPGELMHPERTLLILAAALSLVWGFLAAL
jgi:hypothetical protein